MKTHLTSLLALTLAASGHAAISSYTYDLGEGSANGATVASLICTEDGTKNLTGLANGIGGFTAVTPTTSTATGSTVSLSDTNGNGSIFAGANTFTSTGDFAFQFYFQPGTSVGSYVATSNNVNQTAGAGLLFHATNSGSGTKIFMRSNTGAANDIAALSSYSIGTWYQLTGIVYGTDVNFYIDGVLQGSVAKSTWGTTLLNAPIVGAGSGAAAGTTGGFDAMKILTFDSNTDSLASVQSSLGGGFAAIPEPSTYGLMGAGALAAVAAVRRRRKLA